MASGICLAGEAVGLEVGLEVSGEDRNVACRALDTTAPHSRH